MVGQIAGFSGFERGELENISFSGSVGALGSGVTVQSTVKRSGTYAAKVNPITTQTGSLVLSATNAIAWLRPTIGITGYVRIDTLPASGSEDFLTFDPVGSSASYHIRVDSSGIMHLYKGTTLIVSGSTNNSTGTFRKYSLLSVATAGVGITYEFRINDAVEFSGSYADVAVSSSSHGYDVWWGKKTDRSGQTVLYYIDDVVFATDDTLIVGSYATDLVVPQTTGNYSSWTNGAGTAPTNLTNIPNDGDTSYITTSTDGARSSWICDGSAVGLDEVLAVSFLHTYRRESGTGTILSFYRIGGVDKTFGGSNASTGYRSDASIRAIDHVSGDANYKQAWTVAAVNALEIGVVTSVSSGPMPARVTQLMAEILYRPDPLDPVVGRFTVPSTTVTVASSSVAPTVGKLAVVPPVVAATGAVVVNLAPVVIKISPQPVFDIRAAAAFQVVQPTISMRAISPAPVVLRSRVYATPSIAWSVLPTVRGRWWTVSATEPTIKAEGYVWVDNSNAANPRVYQYIEGVWVDIVTGLSEATTRHVFDGGGASTSANPVSVANITGLNIPDNELIVIDATIVNVNGAFEITGLGIELNNVAVMSGVAMPGTGTGEAALWRIIIPRRDTGDLGGRSYICVPGQAQTITTLTAVPQNTSITSIELIADPNSTSMEIRNVLVRSFKCE